MGHGGADYSLQSSTQAVQAGAEIAGLAWTSAPPSWALK